MSFDSPLFSILAALAAASVAFDLGWARWKDATGQSFLRITCSRYAPDPFAGGSVFNIILACNPRRRRDRGPGSDA
ncbi:hypothetical protein NDR87_13710 [Nocardia sp. CDC159]|uniref:Uncharacterized protein n=1 Tax=Nocardia pulmonis TaxID=2951408 RepID=A0A9X2IZ32_9NOCA|nr:MULTISPECIES: hypothetical protein [Nocardia]MCM6774521.1 hypothetical protein [Nocardia pulmonis]MCM6787413.1 hypothetical protein [Nocardia sp. CDC159]